MTVLSPKLAYPVFGIALASLFPVITGSALAQTASQITRDNYAPPVIRQVGGGLELPLTTGLEVPAGAAELTVTTSGIEIQGDLMIDTPELLRETARIRAGFTNKRVSGTDLFAAARALEAAYAGAGYLLVRVSLPPQTIHDGMPLKLVVTDGYVEAIDISALPEPVRSHIQSVLQPLVGQKRLTKATLERHLLLAGDTPGVMLKSTLKSGEKPGCTVIVLDGQYDAVVGSLSMENGLSEGLGTYSATLGVDFNSIFGRGETGYLRLSGYPGFTDNNIFSDDPRNRQIIAGVILPLGVDGLWLNIEGVDSNTHPVSGLPYTMSDHYQRLSTRLGYNWLRSREINAATSLIFDIADEEQSIHFGGASEAFTSDRLRVLRLTQTGDFFTETGGHLSGELTASFGLDAMGARSPTAILPLSRAGAEPAFQKLEISGRYTQDLLDDRIQVSLAGRAQTSFGVALVSSEQMGLGGYDWLSAYRGGGIEADTGAVLRAEVIVPATLPSLEAAPAIGGAIAPYFFTGAGIARLEKPTAAEQGITRAAVVGAGVRFGLSEKSSPNSMTLSVEYAHGMASGREDEDSVNLRLLAKF